MDKQKAAIVIDCDMLKTRLDAEQYLWDHEEFPWVLLVLNPVDSPPPTGFNFTAVISNTGMLSELEFKRAAMQAINNLSTIIPAVVLDDTENDEVYLMYRENGIIEVKG